MKKIIFAFLIILSVSGKAFPLEFEKEISKAITKCKIQKIQHGGLD